MLTDEQSTLNEPHLPRSTSRTGRPMADRRHTFEAALFILATGCPGRALPRKHFGLPWQTAFHRFNRWRCVGVIDRLAMIRRYLHLLLSDRRYSSLTEFDAR